jgi:catechol 2,3-dioxygenase-like lactoylglutathione lyase family enzyme
VAPVAGEVALKVGRPDPMRSCTDDVEKCAMNDSSLDAPTIGAIHHVELWVPDLRRATDSFGWLLTTLGYEPYQEWSCGRSWILGPTYIVVEESPAVMSATHNRLLPGLNHLAFHAGSPNDVETVVSQAPAHGWSLLFPERHPYAGGPDHYAAYLTEADGFEVELVATKTVT